MLLFNSIFMLASAISSFDPSSSHLFLEQDNQAISDYSDRMVPFYQLEKGQKWRDVTKQVLASPLTAKIAKNSIRSHHRRLIVFEYPSDGLLIKGFISFTPKPDDHPLIILFRWGNQNFALMNPGVNLANYGDYTVVSSALRGGVSMGHDEFGGSDIHDMKNLINFLPQLGEELGIRLPKCMYMIGPSRGGLEMFLTLAHYPELQNRVIKVVALSSILDLHRQILDRPYDMKTMLIEDFGLPKNPIAEENWINKRDPLKTIPYLKKSLPILIIQGTQDPRVNLSEGHHMVENLQKTGHRVDYWEIRGGNHTLSNIPQVMQMIVPWLEETSNILNCQESRLKKQKN